MMIVLILMIVIGIFLYVNISDVRDKMFVEKLRNINKIKDLHTIVGKLSAETRYQKWETVPNQSGCVMKEIELKKILAQLLSHLNLEVEQIGENVILRKNKGIPIDD